MSDRIGEQILVESYKVLYDYITMNESEDAKLDLKIKTFQKIEETITEAASSKQKIFRELQSKYPKQKLENPIAILLHMDSLYSFYRDNENDALELMKMISSNDVDGIKKTGYYKPLAGYKNTKGVSLEYTVGEFCETGRFTLLTLEAINEDRLGEDNYEKFLLRAFPVWVKSAKRILSTLNKIVSELKD